MTDNNISAYEKLTNKITMIEFNALFAMLSGEQPYYDVAIEHVLRVDKGFVVVYSLIAKGEHKRKTSPINHAYQRCAFVVFNQAGKCSKVNDIPLG